MKNSRKRPKISRMRQNLEQKTQKSRKHAKISPKTTPIAKITQKCQKSLSRRNLQGLATWGQTALGSPRRLWGLRACLPAITPLPRKTKHAKPLRSAPITPAEGLSPHLATSQRPLLAPKSPPAAAEGLKITKISAFSPKARLSRQNLPVYVANVALIAQISPFARHKSLGAAQFGCARPRDTTRRLPARLAAFLPAAVTGSHLQRPPRPRNPPPAPSKSPLSRTLKSPSLTTGLTPTRPLKGPKIAPFRTAINARLPFSW